MTGSMTFRQDTADEGALMMAALVLKFAHQPEFFPVFSDWVKKELQLTAEAYGAGDPFFGEALTGWVGKITPGALCEAHTIIGHKLFPEEALITMLLRLLE
jgi:hypothetical protein